MPVRYPAPALFWLRLVAVLGAITAAVTAFALMATPAQDAQADADERTAIALLRQLVDAEHQFAAAAWIDADGDGQGEFGFLAELAGAARLRVDAQGRLGPTVLAEPLLPLAFAEVHSRAVDNGAYAVQLFLPGTDGAWLAEADDGGGAGVGVVANASELQLRAYAWPMVGARGRRAFCIDATGRLLAFDNTDRRYEDRDRPVPPRAIDAVTSNSSAAGARWLPLQ